MSLPPGGREMRNSRGEITIRTALEILLLALVVYAAFQVGPAVFARIKFLNAMEVAANSPIDVDADRIRRQLQSTSETLGLTLLSGNLHVNRDVALQKTRIHARYQIHIELLPGVVYVWNVEDEVEGYYF